MITKAQIRNVLDHPVYDADGNKVGNTKHVFLDDATGEPDWVSVQTGMFGSNESFVPIRDAHMVGDHLEVPYPKDKIKDAPNVDVDAGGHLSAQEEQRLYRHYSIDWDAAWKRANEPSEGRAQSDRTGAAGTTGPGVAGAAGAAGAAGMAGRSRATSGEGMAGETPARGRTAAAGEPYGRDLAGDRRDMAGRDRKGETDTAMTRSEETMHVGTERHEVGRARLHKYVVAEEQEQTIPLRHDEVRVEREPITEKNRGAALSGPEISEADYEVTLYEDRPVVETRVEPVERVRLTTEERIEEETVKGRVRKERIEADMPDKAAEQASREKHERGGPGGAA
ncbi:PRC and DUF2382 domain-containing protein [Streptomyces peucetius]|uniref:PRC and DUF2382 domain-containing protein n=1 Tax=Streptomyces peucetius TaxID=1950 RepID=A0ABY6IIY3_STRPE|nr:PRC and DUF2382 domain-containing protein [Streptomyces peucetius]UYQ66120.1 PRC and DUF2382 domain-containing protein [Streptomyces peucetius]